MINYHKKPCLGFRWVIVIVSLPWYNTLQVNIFKENLAKVFFVIGNFSLFLFKRSCVIKQFWNFLHGTYRKNQLQKDRNKKITALENIIHTYKVVLLYQSFSKPLHEICENKCFHWPVIFHIRTDFFFIRENTGQWEPVFLHIFRIEHYIFIPQVRVHNIILIMFKFLNRSKYRAANKQKE